MANKDFKAPEFLQLKGYKYRAKMLIAGLVILAVILIIIISIIHGISSAVKNAGQNSSDTDTNTDTEQSYVSDVISTDIVDYSTDEIVSSEISNAKTTEEFDADGKLIIDTDTLGGKKAVALTFDDGPGEYTQKLIEGLGARGAKATFFMCGSCVEEYSSVLPMMVNGGHQLGNHTYNHVDITSISNKEMNDQITKTDNAIFNACGQLSTAFRPPYGSYTDDTNRVINKTITMWSIDTADWETRDSSKIKDTIVSKVHDGDIILLHDIYESSVDGALLAIDELSSQGFVFVTVDELLSRYGYEIQRGEAHASQYAVYETNSPYAAQYQKEIDDEKARQAASSAANAFYYESSEKSTDTNSESQQISSDSIPIIQTSPEDTKSRLVY